jgi:hypothetical protein
VEIMGRNGGKIVENWGFCEVFRVKNEVLGV